MQEIRRQGNSLAGEEYGISEREDRENRSLQTNPEAEIVSVVRVISQAAPESADPLPALAVCQS